MWEDVTASTAQLSEAVGSVQVAMAEQLPASLVNARSAGMPLRAGSSSSVTVTLKLVVLLLPAASMAV